MSSPEWCTWPIELCWPRYNEWLYNWIVASLSYGMAATDTRTRAVYSGAFQCVACPLFWLHATWGLFPWPLQLKIIAKSIYKITLFPSFLPSGLLVCLPPLEPVYYGRCHWKVFFMPPPGAATIPEQRFNDRPIGYQNAFYHNMYWKVVLGLQV